MHLTEPWLRASVTFLRFSGKKETRIRSRPAVLVHPCVFPSLCAFFEARGTLVRFFARRKSQHPLFVVCGGEKVHESSTCFDYFKLQDILRLFRSHSKSALRDCPERLVKTHMASDPASSSLFAKAMEVLGVTAYNYSRLPEISED